VKKGSSVPKAHARLRLAYDADYHTSDIGHWFAMTGIFVHFALNETVPFSFQNMPPARLRQRIPWGEGVTVLLRWDGCKEKCYEFA